MRESTLKHYEKLNGLAQQEGIVIFGCGEDTNIPTGELRQAFSVEENLYNRSLDRISIQDAPGVYEEIVAPLAPETVMLHFGETDKSLFAENASAFDHMYRKLIAKIKSYNKKCRIALVSLKNYDNDPQTDEMNRHIKYIADSEQCEYGDIATPKVWNPKATMDVSSFLSSIGFVRPQQYKRPLYDLVKILFCYEA